ncbi:MAG: signal peptidase I [Nibricoccus sp.]
MQNSIPAAFSHPSQKRKKFQYAFTLLLAYFSLSHLAQADQRVAQPQAQTFTDAYHVALNLVQQRPGVHMLTVASTYSMYPKLDWDSIVVVAPVSIDQVQVGDIVCFRDQSVDGQRKIVHRVVKILRKDHRLVTRGDNLDRPDLRPVDADALIGKVTHVVYFDRTGQQRPVDHVLPTPVRYEQVIHL